MIITAAEKAKELVNKFKPSVYCYSGSGMLTNTPDEGVILMMSKCCATIAVQEILDHFCESSVIDHFLKSIEYYQEVKLEIDKLELELESETK